MQAQTACSSASLCAQPPHNLCSLGAIVSRHARTGSVQSAPLDGKVEVQQHLVHCPEALHVQVLQTLISATLDFMLPDGRGMASISMAAGMRKGESS